VNAPIDLRAGKVSAQRIETAGMLCDPRGQPVRGQMSALGLIDNELIGVRTGVRLPGCPARIDLAIEITGQSYSQRFEG
jgi:hypothetical protein